MSQRQATVVLSNSSLDLDASRAVAGSRFPAVVVETRSHRVLAESPSAAALLDPAGGSVVGCLLEDLTTDEPQDARDLLSTGRVPGFEAIGVSTRLTGGIPVRLWLRRFDHQDPSDHLLVVLVPEDAAEALAEGPPARLLDGMGGVAGTTDQRLQVVQLSDGAAPLFGASAEDLLGVSLLSLVAVPDRARVRAGAAEAAENGCAITLSVDAHHLGSTTQTRVSGCELLIVPLRPSPSCLFVFAPTGAGLARARISEDLATVLARLTSRAAPTARPENALPAVQVLPGHTALTPREREVLAMVAAGHRVSVIARALFLSESTVRTHVAATERKLGVSSQHGLRELLAAAGAARTDPAAPRGRG